MKKYLMFITVGALAWSLQACNSNQNADNNMDSTDSIYNKSDENNRNIPPKPGMNDTSSLDPMDSTNRADSISGNP